MSETYLGRVIEFVMSVWSKLNEAVPLVLDFMTSSLSEVAESVDIPIVSNILDFLASTFIGDVSVVSFMFGTSIGVFLALTLVKWLIGIIT